MCGPLSVKSISGFKYFVTFIDDFSRKIFLYPIKEKSDVYNEFIKFKNLVENQHSRKIKILRTDNGTEYCNNKFKSFLTNCGIIHQTSTPYTPQQNGISERYNRTIIERVRCMLLDADLNKTFWAEAATTAAYLLNRIPCRSDAVTPEEMWTNQKPDLSNIRIFGCKSMVHIPKEKRRKLDSKSIECILLGYCTNTKAYRLYNISTKKIIISRDVIFLENNSKVNRNLNNNSSSPTAFDDNNNSGGEDYIELNIVN